jgi:hypothetical protein
MSAKGKQNPEQKKKQKCSGGWLDTMAVLA